MKLPHTVDLIAAYLKKHQEDRRTQEAGVSAIDWLLVIIAVVAIAGIVIAAVNGYVQTLVGRL